MEIATSVINLAQGGFFIDSNFTNSKEKISVPFLDQMKHFLNQLIIDGVKLTKIGNLPTVFVKDFIHTVDKSSVGSSGLRYTENDFISIQRVKIVSLTIKCTVVKNNTIYITKEGKEFLKLSDSQQLIYLLDMYARIFNMGYFDRYGDATIVQSIALDLLSVIALYDEFLDFKEYINIVRSHFPKIDELIEGQIHPSPYQKTKLEAFYGIAKHRIFEQFLPLFGLVEKDNERYKASSILKLLAIKPNLETLATDEKLTGNKIKQTKQQFLDLGYDVNLFFEFFHLSSKLASKNEVTFEMISKDVFERLEIKKEDEEPFIQIHTNFYMMVGHFYNWLLAEERGDEPESVIQDAMNSLSSGLFHQIPLTLMPMPVIEELESSILFSLFDLLDSHHVNLNNKDILEEIKEKLNPFVYDKVEHFFQVLTVCKHEAKNSKRLTKQFKEDVKLLIMNFIVICWDVMIYNEDE